jgi:hypothetical protein
MEKKVILYKIQNALTGRQDCDSPNDPVCKLINDTFTVDYKATPYRDDLGPGAVEEIDLKATINARSLYLGRGLNPTLVYKEPSLASDEEDFWSFDTLGQFLGIAERRGAAICQLLKRFSASELDDVIRAIQRGYYSIKQLQKIFYSTRIKSPFWEFFALNNEEHLKKLRKELVNEYIPCGTGFVVGKNYLLTNHHILPSADEAKNFIARFRYERTANDGEFRPVDYYLDSSCFATSPESELDYTLIKLFRVGDLDGEATNEQIQEKRQDYKLQFLEAGENFGWLPLFEDDALVAPPISKEQANEFKDQLKLNADLLEKACKSGLPGEPVNIIQHPRGRAKEIVFYSNRVQKLTSRYLHYQADTDLGSSGSPVLNAQWQVVALHHAVLVEARQDEHETLQMTAQGSIGIRISEIVKDLKNSEDTSIKEFVENFVIKSDDKPHRGRIYILAGVKREEVSGIAGEDFNEAEMMVKLRDKIQAAEINEGYSLKDYGYSVEIIPNELPSEYLPNKSLNYKENVIRAWIDQRKEAKDLDLGDFAIELSMDAYTERQQKTLELWGVKVELSLGALRQKMIENESLRGIGIYYAGTRDERRYQAELILKTLLNQKRAPKSRKTIETVLPNRGVRSDDTILGAISRRDTRGQLIPGLPFCQDIGIPSFVLRLGFVTNAMDRHEIAHHSDAIAKGIAKGLLALGNSMNAIPVEIYQTQNNFSEYKFNDQYFLSF